MTLILASESPRRRALLSRLTADFVVEPSRIAERADGSPAERAVDVARAKAHAVGRGRRAVVIGADTIVVIDGEILGKPVSREEARVMLGRLSGRAHRVLTGLCVLDVESGAERVHCEETRVLFRRLDEDEIEAYLDTGEYRDKAGGYAIQGGAAQFVSGIEGDYTNVIGLPLCRLSVLLREMGVRL